MLAPVWWIDDVGQAYGAAKYLNVLLMTAVVFPTYGLARMVVSKPWALFAAAGAGAIPALYYSSMLVEEPLAYPVGDARRVPDREGARGPDARWWIGSAGRSRHCSLRSSGSSSPSCRRPSCWRRSRSSRRARGRNRSTARWSRWDWIGGITLAVGAVIVGQRRDLARLLRVADLDDLLQGTDARERPLGRGRARDRRRRSPDGRRARRARASGASSGRASSRAVVATMGALIFGYGWYTAVKAAYISSSSRPSSSSAT